ncbi:response regulator, partial [Cribrihabitans sp. XS_ASV171]
IRALPTPQPRIIALTANAFDSDRRACEAAGMNDFLAKPVSRDELLATILRHVEGAEAEAEAPGRLAGRTQ